MIIKAPPEQRSFFVLRILTIKYHEINIFQQIYYACIIFFPNFEFIQILDERKNHRLCIKSHMDGCF